MSQFSPADVALPGASRARPQVRSVLALRNWRLASRLIALVAIPTVLGLTLAAFRIDDSVRSAEAYGQISRLAVLGQRVTALSQAMEDERTDTAAFLAAGRPAGGVAALDRQYVITDRSVSTVRRLIQGLGSAYPAQTQASATTILAGIGKLPELRKYATQRPAPALITVVDGYSAAIVGLFQISNGMAGLSGNPALITSARTLDALSRMADQALLQRAILSAALAGGQLSSSALATLTGAEAQQAVDLASFRSSATPEQSWALSSTLAEPLADQARTVERRATAAGGGALALGGGARRQWAAGTAYTTGWMGHAEQQLAGWITAYAQDLRRSAIRSAMATSGVTLTLLLLVAAATVIICRSIVRPLRRLEAAALDVAETRLPAAVSAAGVAGNSGRPIAAAPMDVQSAGEIGQVARAVDRVHREAVRLAGEEASIRGSLHAIFVSFLRRSSSLQEPMLRLIDDLELGEDDPDRLATLFQMDQLATRMRRNSDSALVLAGDQTPGRWTEPVTLVDLLRAAQSEIEQYDRVILDVEPAVSVAASAAVTADAAVDIVHLLAELLENAATFSPATTTVQLSGATARGGSWLVSITDAGPGIPEEQLGQLNEQLAHPPLADAAVGLRMGLFAVAHLAALHGIYVEILPSPAGGTIAEVHIPAALISRQARPIDRTGGAGEIPWAGTGSAGTAVAADPWYTAPRYAAGPVPAMEPPAAADLAVGDAIPLLGAPLPPLPAAPSFTATEPEPARADWPGAEWGGGQPADGEGAGGQRAGTRSAGTGSEGAGQAGQDQAGLPIFDSVESGYLGVYGAGRRRAGAAGTAPGGLTSAGLPQRDRRASLAVPETADRDTSRATELASAHSALHRLASFQQGSRRARADAQLARDPSPAQDR